MSELNLVTEILEDASAVTLRVAEWLTEQARAAVQARGRFVISLSGGSTPKTLYETLAKVPFVDRFPWAATHLFWGDERFVPADHPDSNYKMVRTALTDHVPIPAANIHPMPTDGTPKSAAERYQATLADYNGGHTLEPARPLFDVVLLGIGTDGHTASLFPGTAVLNEKTAWVKEVVGAKPEVRLTLTYPVLESSRVTAFLVTGVDKHDIAERIRSGDTDLPAARIKTAGTLRWFMDAAAGK